LTQLRRLLVEEKRQGYAVEDSFISPGLSSVASAAVDHAGHPVAAISVTFRTDAVPPADRHLLAHRIRQAATALTRRLHG
jgi:DNA-binding IclR family transcriptional regulator